MTWHQNNDISSLTVIFNSLHLLSNLFSNYTALNPLNSLKYELKLKIFNT